MKKATVYNVADWFLAKESMTPKKLQKIVYYAYAWVLTLMSENKEYVTLFDDDFAEAWVHGPVFPKLYQKYKKYGWNEIEKNTAEVFNFGADVNDILEQVWTVYGEYNGNQLESITHQEEPWIRAREGCSIMEPCETIIKDVDIYNYYSAKVSD